MPKFADFSGNKTYECKKCHKNIKYAKFYDDKGLIITVDGEQPNGKGMEKTPDGKWVNFSNVFTAPVNLDQTIHDCYSPKWPEKEQKELKSPIVTKDPNTLIIEIPAQTDLDRRVLEKLEANAYNYTFQVIAKYKGVRTACLQCGIKEGAVIGMIFNNVCKEDLK